MTRLLLAMLSVRRTAALTVLVLAAVAAAAAASGPFYRSAARNAATSVEVANATAAEQTIRRSYPIQRAPGDPTPVAQGTSQQPRQPYLPGFDTVAGLEVTGRAVAGVTGPQADDAQPTGAPIQPVAITPAGTSTGKPIDGIGMAYRAAVCQHVRIVAGRCISGAQEVLLSERDAEILGVRVGDALSFQTGIVINSFQPDGPAVALVMVGTYRARNAAEPYWAGRAGISEAPAAASVATPLTPGGVEQTGEAMFATRETVSDVPFTNALESVDLIAHRSAFDDPDRLRAIVTDEQFQGSAQQYQVSSDIPDLLDRAEANRQSLADGVQLAALPLVLLCWFVLYLAVANGAFRRRGEFGLAGLRGVPRLARWWIGAAEYTISLLVGAPLGYLAGLLAFVLLAGQLLPDDPRVGVTADSIGYAGVSVGGALLVGLLAQARTISAPVAVLLRRVPTRRLVTRLGAAEAIAVALTVAAGYQIRSGGARAGGLALLAPLLVALSVGLLAARGAGLAADRVGRRALRRGVLGRALAAFTLARQPGQARLLALFVMVFAVLGFAVTAVDVAAQARAARVRTELGASRVIQVNSMPARTLLAAVRAADPDGRYAMAAGLAGSTALSLMAVDTTRLAQVATWDRGYGMAPEQVARLLHPQDPTQIRFAGTGVQMRVTVGATQMKGVRLLARLLPDQTSTLRVELGELRPGRTVYPAAVPQCASGCRLLALELAVPSATRYDLDLTLNELRLTQPDAVLVNAGGFADAGRWGGQVGATEVPLTATPGGTGLRLSHAGVTVPQSVIAPVGTPRRLPVLATGPIDETLPATGSRVAVTRVGRLPVIPGLGAPEAPADSIGVAGLIDLSYLDVADATPTDLRESLVWLAADAPPQVVDRLRQAGLVAVTDRTAQAELALLNRRGPALALHFYLLAAIAAVALGIGGLAVIAAADRAGQAEALRALRVQGLPSKVPWRVGLGGYAALTAMAAVLGALAAAVAWWLARTVIPLFTDGGETLYAPATPHALRVVLPMLAAVVVLVAAAAVAAASLHRAVEGP